MQPFALRPSPFALRPSPFALRPSPFALIALLAPSLGHAGEHPLRAEGTAAARLIDEGYTVDEAVAAVAIFTTVEIAEDGTSTVRVGAELPDVVGESAIDDTDLEESTCIDGELPTMDSEVERLLYGSDASERIRVSFLVGTSSTPETFGMAWARANLESRGRDAPDAQDIRHTLATARLNALAPEVAGATRAIQAMGGDILEVGELSGTIEAEVDAAALADILTLPEVIAAQADTPSVSDIYSWSTPGWSTGSELSGEELEEIIQTRILYRHLDGPYLGSGAGIGLVEPDGDKLYLIHEGWEDGYEVSRVSNCNWTSGHCVPYSPTIGDQHATAVASVIVGDLTLGQDPGFLTLSAERKRSGVARAASLVGMDSVSKAAVEAWATTAFQGTMINHSSHSITDCTGNTPWARTINAIYESGIAWFNSMGNESHDDVATCTAVDAASALGAFAVSAIVWDDDATTNGISDDNSRGGVGSSPANGRSRSIVGLSAPTLFQFPYVHRADMVDCTGMPMTYGTDWPKTEPCGPEGIGHTSGAAPVVAGAAAVFKEYFLDAFNTSIEDPGTLYTNLLLMGDRAQQTAYVHADTFDNLWGAGLLRLRTFDSYGLDNPAGWSTGSVCVGSDDSVTLPSGSTPGFGQSLPTAADYLRVVTWWYDRRVDDGIFSHDHDNVDLRLARTGTTNQTYNSASDDNRQRLTVASSVGGSTFSITLLGRDVTADDEGCGTDSMRVYWAWMYEDSARDDTDSDLDHDSVMAYTRVEP